MRRVIAFFLIAVAASAISSCSKIEPELYISESPSNYNVASMGGNITINISHNTSYNISIDVDWISALQTKGLKTDGLTFKIAENTTNQVRKGVITFSTEDSSISQTAEIVQAGLYEIYYTSRDDREMSITNPSAFDAKIISNTYKDGKGTITFDKPVTIIGETAFYYSKLTNIEIPNTVTKIGNKSFAGSLYLTGIDIPENVTEIGESAFDGCKSLKIINIPENITNIKAYTFTSCLNLTEITIPDNIHKIGMGVFDFCTSLASFNGKFASSDKRSLIINDTLAAIATHGITSYSIPEGVSVLGSLSIWSYDESTGIGNTLTNITFPESLKEIERNAFSQCAPFSKMYFLSATPPVLKTVSSLDNNISLYLTNESKIFVPKESVNAYKNAEGWKEHAQIIFPIE